MQIHKITDESTTPIRYCPYFPLGVYLEKDRSSPTLVHNSKLMTMKVADKSSVTRNSNYCRYMYCPYYVSYHWGYLRKDRSIPMHMHNSKLRMCKTTRSSQFPQRVLLWFFQLNNPLTDEGSFLYANDH